MNKTHNACPKCEGTDLVRSVQNVEFAEDSSDLWLIAECENCGGSFREVYVLRKGNEELERKLKLYPQTCPECLHSAYDPCPPETPGAVQGEQGEYVRCQVCELKLQLATNKATPLTYRLSRDYAALYEFICAGNVAAGWVDYDVNRNGQAAHRDVVQIKRFGEFDIFYGVRGHCYGGIYRFYENHGEEKTLFINLCEATNLAWIEP